MLFDRLFFIFSLLFCLFGWQPGANAQQAVLSGKILDARNGSPLVGANLILVDANGAEKGCSADATGFYEIEGLDPGRYQLTVSYLGYIPITENGYLIGSGPSTSINFNLQADPDLNLTPVELTALRTEAVVNPLKRSLSLEAVKRLPATFYDPARMLALTPGVAQVNDQANHLSVRGNAPNKNLWRLNGLAIVNPNHTANAGTVSDLPTLNGGGVNALSAQLLDNSTFYSAGLPAAYGHATGGTLDMQLRPGNTKKRQHQLQAGFIGFDLSTEGPFAKGKPNSGSYLVNYRYSFTGLLADMGADFGGEEIRFQDFSANLYQPIGKKGELSLFGLYGNSSNDFTGKDEDIEEEKEYFDINFKSDLLITGLNYKQYIGSGQLTFGLAYSEMETDHASKLRSIEINPNGFVRKSALEQGRLSGRLQYDYTPSTTLKVTAGAEYLRDDILKEENYNLLWPIGGLESHDYNRTSISPYFEINKRVGNFGLRAGLRYVLNPDLEDSDVLEPRLALNYHAGRHLFHITAERNSNVPNQVLLDSTIVNKDLIATTDQLGFGWQLQTGAGDVLSINTYVQYTKDDYALFIYSGIDEVFYIPINNALYFFGPSFSRERDSRTYGVELSYQRPIKPEALYYSVNLSIFRSEFLDYRHVWQQGRFSRNTLFQGVLGKEWTSSNKKGKTRTFGVNAAVIATGGDRLADVQLLRAAGADELTIDEPVNQMPVFIRPDLRLYRRKYHKKTTTTLALDIQNLIGRKNVAYRYYDSATRQVEDRNQLGFIPVLSYRVEWR